jgi:hypothetical protein
MPKFSMQDKIEILRLADELGNVSKVCKILNISRPQFYQYKKRYLHNGLQGLENMPSIHNTHPQQTSSDTIAKILFISMQNPAWGCARISRELTEAYSLYVSPPTIQSILNKHGLRSKQDRFLRLEEKSVFQSLSLKPEQMHAIIKFNPRFKERLVSSHPGELLVQDVFLLGRFYGLDKVYIHTVVDTCCSYGFASINSQRSPEISLNILQNQVLSFYANRGMRIEAIGTSSSKDYTGAKIHPYELFLNFNNIKHSIIYRKRNDINGFSKYFFSVIEKEFFQNIFDHDTAFDLSDVQLILNIWLDYYNTERPNHGYPNWGKTPLDLLKSC